jgi:DNA topoisomerase-2
MKKKQYEPMDPWWQGFEGTVYKIDDYNYEIYGQWSITDNKLTITELPVGKWTSDYKEFLEKMLENISLRAGAGCRQQPKKTKKDDEKTNPFISYKDNNTDTKVHFELKFEDDYLDNVKDIDKKYQLYKKYSITNMHLYGPEGHIKRYDTTEEIMRDYYHVRLDLYQKRKDYQLSNLEHQLKLISNKVKFILMVVEKKLNINNKKRCEIEEKLEIEQFQKIGPTKTSTNVSYDYLLTMPIYNLTSEKIEELKKQQDEKQAEYDDLNSRTPMSIWAKELDILEARYEKWYKQKIAKANNTGLPKKITTKKLKTKQTKS